MANFASDNTAAVHPAVMTALANVNTGNAAAYGHDETTQALNIRLQAVFGNPDLRAFPVFNGSACNGLALSRMIRPYESVLAHQQAHINNDECGLPEFFTGGKLVPLEGQGAKIDPDGIARLIESSLGHSPHTSRPRVISVTQSTELGTTYKLEELRALRAIADRFGMFMHMDGARIANAVASLGADPAEVVRGIDILSFGGTKNGGMLAEAAVILNPALIDDFAYIHKRAGQLPSKARYVSAQLLALLTDDLWIALGAQANAMAQALRDGLLAMDGIGLLYPVEANEVFVTLPKAKADAVLAKGHRFYPWPHEGDDAYRLVTSYMTPQADVETFLSDCVNA